jgi:hypothetical protein
MKRYTTSKTLLAGAALAGIISGGQIATAATVTKVTPSGISAGVLADQKKGETHDCKGKNSCKGKGGCAVKDGKPVHVQPKK